MTFSMKKAGLAAALAATTALVPVSGAWAANVTGFEANAEIKFQAPVGSGLGSNVDDLRIGKTNVVFTVGTTGIGGGPLTDDFVAKAVLFSAGSAVSVVTGTIGGAAAGPVVDNALVAYDLSGAPDFDEVVFMLVDDNSDVGTETIDGLTTGQGVIVFEPTSGRLSLGADSLTVLDNGAAFDDASDIAVAAVAAKVRASSAFANDSYTGPRALRALVADTTAADNPEAYIEFDTYVVADSDGNFGTGYVALPAGTAETNTVTGLEVTPRATAATGDGDLDTAPATSTDNFGAVALATVTPALGAASPTAVIHVTDQTDGTDTDFDAVITAFEYDPTQDITADVAEMDQAAGAGVLFDEAGNAAVARTGLSGITVENLPSPAFTSATGAKAVVVSATTATLDDLYSADGFTFTGAQTINLNVIFASAVTDEGGTVDSDDFTVANAGAAGVYSSGDGTAVVTLQVTPVNGTKLRVDSATGQLYNITSGSDVAVTVNLAVDTGDALETVTGGVVLATAPSSAKDVFSGVAPTPEVKTVDANTGAGLGIVDGYVIDYGLPITVGDATAFKLNTNAGHADVGARVDLGSANYTVSAGAEAVTVALNESVTDPTTLDLDGNGTAGEAGDDTPFPAAYRTGGVAATLGFSAEASSDTANTYSAVFDTTAGTLAELPATAAANNNITVDGATPVILSVSRTKTTDEDDAEIDVIFSESIGAAAVSGFTANGASLPILAVNEVDDGAALALNGRNNITSTTALGANLGSVSLDGVDETLLTSLTEMGIGAGQTSIYGSAAADTAAAQTFTTLGAVTDAVPAFEMASAVVNADREVTSILVFFDGNVVANGTDLASTFDINVVGNEVVPSAATVLAAAPNVVQLTLPTPVKLRSLDIASGAITVDYDQTADDYLDDANDAKVADFAAKAVTIPQGSTGTFTMDIRGLLSQDVDDTPVEQGTLVRADLVRFDTVSNEVKEVLLNVPCACGNNNTKSLVPTLAGFASYAALTTALETAADAGKSTLTAYVGVDYDADGNVEDVTLGSTAANAVGGAATSAMRIEIPTTLDTRNGTRITGGVTGELKLGSQTTGNSLVNDDTVYTVTDAAGKYRLNVGSDSYKADRFVVVSVKRPGQDWVMVSSADKSMINYLPFKQDIGITTARADTSSTKFAPRADSGSNGSVIFDIPVSEIHMVDLSDVPTTNKWTTVGIQGEVYQNSNKRDFKMRRFMVTINEATGAPVSLFVDGAAGADEAFVLENSTVASAFELGSNYLDNIGAEFDSGDGVAVSLDASGTADSLFFPVKAASAVAQNMAAGWHLVTAQDNVSSIGNFGIGGSTVTESKVAMVIDAGGNLQARSWIKGADQQSLTSLEKGKAYFVYLSASMNGFTFK